jgi:hypothetical protein
MKRLRYVESSLKYPTAAICTYEALAIFTGRAPSITQFTSRHRWIAPVVAGLTIWHLMAWPCSEESV